MTFKNRPAHSLWPLITGFALLLLAVGGATAVSIAQQKQSLYVRAALERENNLNRILGLVTDAETGQRGYLLTGKDAYLDPYLAAKRDLLAEIDVLAPQIREFGSNSRIAELRQAASDKLAELKSTIDARRAGRADDALGILNSDRGLQLMQRIRESVAAMRLQGQKDLESAVASMYALRLASQIGLAIAIAIAGALAALTIRDARRAVAELLEANEHLELEIAERKQATSQVRQLQKLEAVGQLTSGIAHDFNNMLAIVIGSLDIARRRLAGTEHPSILQCINNAAEGAERASVLTARLLAFSRQQPLDPKILDINKLVSGMSELLRRTIGETIKIETVLAGGLWRTFVDPSQVESTLLNLVINARDAMPNGGKLTVETQNAYLDEAYASQHEEVAAGQYVMISVTDTGYRDVTRSHRTRIRSVLHDERRR